MKLCTLLCTDTDGVEFYQTVVLNGAEFRMLIANGAELVEIIEENNGFLPRSYAEIEYSDFDSVEAYEGARFDDMNYMRYRER